jgi:RNA polymerase sigma-70 factor (ECF subfamily)
MGRAAARAEALRPTWLERVAIAHTARWSVILPAPVRMSSDDAATIRAVLDGDVERYADLVDTYQAQAIRLAFSLLGNYHDAEDAAQQAFISAYHGLARFRGRAAFSTWLYRIVVNVCRTSQRTAMRRPRVVAEIGPADAAGESEAGLFVVDAADESHDPRRHAENVELSAQLSSAIRRLPEHQQTAFLLHHVHGLSIEEAAGVMSCRPGTVKSHLFRATASLQRQLGPWLSRERG